MGYFLFSLVLVFNGFRDTSCEQCRETSLTSAPREFSCPSGCCGEIYQRYCCNTNGSISLEAIIASITVAAVVLVALIVGCFVYLCKKKTPRRVVAYPGYEDNHRRKDQSDEIITQDTDYFQTDSSLPSTYSGPINPGYGAYR